MCGGTGGTRSEWVAGGTGHGQGRHGRAGVTIAQAQAQAHAQKRQGGRPKERARLYRIARRSATESAAVIELLQRRAVRLGKPVEHPDTARAMLLRLVRMLVRMIQATESRRDGP
jgi:hypothetical protein